MTNRLVAAFFFLCIYTVNSQEFSVGARGGFNTTSIGDVFSRGTSLPGSVPDIPYAPVQDIGFQFGGYLTVEFGRIFLQPEVNYMVSKNHYDFPLREAKWQQNHLEVPLLAGVRVIGPISVYGGPSFNFYEDAGLEGVDVTAFSDGGPDLEKNTMSVNFGVMVKWNRFTVDLRYEKGLKENERELLDIRNSVYGVNLADRMEYKTNVLSLSLMVDIFKTNTEDMGGFFSGLFRNNKKCYCPY